MPKPLKLHNIRVYTELVAGDIDNLRPKVLFDIYLLIKWHIRKLWSYKKQLRGMPTKTYCINLCKDNRTHGRIPYLQVFACLAKEYPLHFLKNCFP